MKLNLCIDTEKDEQEIIINLVNYLFSNKNNISQMKLDSVNKNNNIKDKPYKYFCNNKSCCKEITKEVVAFCLHKDNKDRFKGKVFCRDCQEDR